MKRVLSFLLLLTLPVFLRAIPLQLATGNQFQPFADDQLLNGGITTDIVRRAYSHIGNKITIEFLPWPRGYEGTRQHHYFATFPYARTPEREQDFHYSIPILTVSQKVFVRAGSNIDSFHEEQLKGATGCQPIGWFINDQTQSMLDRQIISMHRPPNMENCFRMLKEDRVHYVYVDELTGWFIIRKYYPNEIHAFRTLNDAFNPYTLHLLISKSYPDADKYLKQFNQTIRSFEDSGIIKQIIDRHMGAD